MQTGDLVIWSASKNQFVDEVGIIASLEERGDDDGKYEGAWVIWSQNQGPAYAWSPLNMLSVLSRKNSNQDKQ